MKVNTLLLATIIILTCCKKQDDWRSAGGPVGIAGPEPVTRFTDSFKVAFTRQITANPLIASTSFIFKDTSSSIFITTSLLNNEQRAYTSDQLKEMFKVFLQEATPTGYSEDIFYELLGAGTRYIGLTVSTWPNYLYYWRFYFTAYTDSTGTKIY